MFDENKNTAQKPERIIVKISDDTLKPPNDPKVRSLDAAIEATTGIAVKSGSSKITQEAARGLWRRGTDPDKLEFAIKQSSVTLNERDKNDLFKIVQELRKLKLAYPETTKKFNQGLSEGSEIEIRKHQEGESSRADNSLQLVKGTRGIQIDPSEWKGSDLYDPGYIKEAEKYVDDISTYADDLGNEEVPSNYREPETSPPRMPEISRSYSQPRERVYEPSVPRKAVGSMTRSARQTLSGLTKSAQTSAKLAVRKGLNSLAAAAAPIAAQIALIAGIAGALLLGFIMWLTHIIITIIIWAAGFSFFVLIILFIINSGAYIVPPGSSLERGEGTIPPSGGLTVNCPPDSSEITDSLASRIGLGAIRNLLPIGTGPRGNGVCIIPTMIIMHWSAGYDNSSGNENTYNTLISANSGAGLACQVATDTNDIYLMQPFYENSVEYPWCANSWNIYSINNELAGGCNDSCNTSYSECDPRDTLAFDDNPPHPCTPEVDRALATTCVLMSQYGIPWCQIRGHYNVPDSGGKIDPGREFLENFFKPAIQSRCPNDPQNLCGGGVTVDPACQVGINDIPTQIANDMTNGGSWRPGCPVALNDLKYLTVSYWGYDNARHDDGHLIINENDAANIASVFRSLCSNRFPINKMVLIDDYYSGGMENSDRLSMEDNNTSAFNCRCLSGETSPCDYSRSVHSYGRAIDINPRQNPYISGTTTLPAGASYSPSATGTITSTGTAFNSFRNINWYWGGLWSNPVDYMHFSYNNQ